MATDRQKSRPLLHIFAQFRVVPNIRPAELFKEAVRVNAAAILLAHNHPGGSAEPSPEDERTTDVAVQAGGILGISVLDHLVIGRGVWVSMKEQGLGFST